MEKGDKIIHDFNESSNSKQGKKINMSLKKSPVILFLILALLGVGTGFVFAQIKSDSTVNVAGPGGTIQSSSVEEGETFGSSDEKTFNDSAEGTLRTGGIEGEGAYHLERPGGESQNVYLTSSVLDLSTFVGKKVKVWGQTNASKKAGWLMDVGRLQVL